MKKFVVSILSAVLCLGLFGCGGQLAGADSEASESAAEIDAFEAA